VVNLEPDRDLIYSDLEVSLYALSDDSVRPLCLGSTYMRLSDIAYQTHNFKNIELQPDKYTMSSDNPDEIESSAVLPQYLPAHFGGVLSMRTLFQPVGSPVDEDLGLAKLEMMVKDVDIVVPSSRQHAGERGQTELVKDSTIGISGAHSEEVPVTIAVIYWNGVYIGTAVISNIAYSTITDNNSKDSDTDTMLLHIDPTWFSLFIPYHMDLWDCILDIRIFAMESTVPSAGENTNGSNTKIAANFSRTFGRFLGGKIYREKDLLVYT